MLGLIESLVAISAIIITCRFAGRIPAMMVTAVAAVSAAIIMPPFASWEVESITDVLTVVFQTIIGLAVAYKWPAKNGAVDEESSPPQPRPRSASATGRSINKGRDWGGVGQEIQSFAHHPPGASIEASPYRA